MPKTAATPSDAATRRMAAIERAACFMAHSFVSWRVRIASVPRDHDLEVLARHDHRAVPRPVEPLDQRHEIALERGLRRRFERSESLEHRAVVGLEDVQP